jgi:hypothetical protein
MSNEISEDFKKLVVEKKEPIKDDSYESESSSESSIRHSDVKGPSAADNQKNMMEQQNMIQQQMKQQQMLQQQMLQQKAQQTQVPVVANVANVENVDSSKSMMKIVSKLGVVLALFFVLASSQTSGLLNAIPYLDTLPGAEYINLFIRALLFVVLYFVLDTFVL